MTGGARTAPHNQDRLALALALDHRIAIGGATQAIAVPDGGVILTPDLLVVRHLNEIVLDAPLDDGLDSAALVALADRWLDGLPHALSAWMTRPARVWRAIWSGTVGSAAGR